MHLGRSQVHRLLHSSKHLVKPRISIGIAQRFSTSQKMPLQVLVFADKGSPALKSLPKPPEVTFKVISSEEDAEQLESEDLNAMVYVPPADPATLVKVLSQRQPTESPPWLHSFAAGVDGLIPGLTKLGMSKEQLLFSNGRGAFSESLAEYAMTAILHFNKQVPRILANRKAKLWDRFEMDVIAGKTLGIVGYGHIGQMCAKYAKSMGMKVIAMRRNLSKTDGAEYVDTVYGFEERKQLYEQSDFVLCALPGTKETTDFFSKEAFEAMKSSAVFLSIGRGVCVDEDALVQALLTAQIKGAALDVFKEEPLPASSELWNCENLLITAHNADLTFDYFQLGWQTWEDNLKSYLGKGEIVTPVDIRSGY